MTVLNSEFTHFNLVIRLSKVKQPAFLFSPFFKSPAAPAVPWEPVRDAVLSLWSRAEQPEILCFAAASACDKQHARMYDKATGMSSSCRCGLFGFW